MVFIIYTIIMVLKLNHKLGTGNLKLFERRRGCGGIPNLVVLQVLAFFFLIMSCFILNKEIHSSPQFFWFLQNGYFSKQIEFIVSPKMQAPLIISKPLYSSKQTQRNTLFILF
jgi:pheromone shutdown protein TraB